MSERGGTRQGAKKSQRAQLAERLAIRSETLILLSATPHDGKPESFASLMEMLDPTAIANPSDYTKHDIKDLYVRRFRKDVLADLRSNVKERDTKDVECQASNKEERVFALLKDLKLPDSDRKAKAGQLFKTTLAKSLLSSPMAALETVSNRLKRLEDSATESRADVAALQELKPLLNAISATDFSKYQRLLELIGTDWSWKGKDTNDRIVIFTGRRETQRFLMEHLAADLGLKAGAVVGLDGAMPDVEQTRVVEQFAQGERSGSHPGVYGSGIRRPQLALPQPSAGALRHPLVVDDIAAAQWPHRSLWPTATTPDPLFADAVAQ